MVRIAMLIPESYQLFICPAACGRHGALGAITHGIKQRLSYYFVEEEDVVQGYDNLVSAAADALLLRLSVKNIRPRVLTLFVTCIDDLIGTDTEAIAQDLEERHPGIRFTVCHMNPIRDNGKEPPMVLIHKSIYPLLYREKPGKKDKGINCLGNLEKIPDTCEIYKIVSLFSAGPLRHISQYETFDKFLEMGKSLCNFVFAAPAAPAAKELERNCGQPWISMEVHMDPLQIRKQYERMGQALAAYLDTSVPGEFCRLLDRCERETEVLVKKTCETLRNCPVAVDDFACPDPFELAIFLLRKGFNVRWVVYKEVGGQALEGQAYLTEAYPQVQQLRSIDYRVPRQIPGLQTGESEGSSERSLLAIGLEAAYVLQADYIVDVACEQGRYGYQGLQEILRLMQQVYGKKADLQRLIEKHGLVV